MSIRPSVVAVIAPMVLVSSCFTGIESTPKITANDVKKQNVVITPEQRFIAGVGVIPFSQWHAGKRFYVTDDKIALAFGASSHGVGNMKGGLLTYIGLDSVTDVAGNNIAVLSFSNDSGDTLVYRTDFPIKILKSKEAMEIPYAIDLDVVACVNETLATKELFILTPAWLNADGASVNGRKFVKVVIDKVIPGNSMYPLMVCFTDDKGTKGAVYMSLGASRQATRNFDTLFSFRDPRVNYQNVSDENWDRIKNGQVALEMTREECRLALGSPKEIDRRPGYGGVAERWIYPDGVYLLFEDGVLSDFRR